MNVETWVAAFSVALQPMTLLYIFLGTLFGLFVGALPGLGPLFAVTLMLPITFYMDPATAMIFLTAIQVSAVYGGSWAAILINTPGSVGSVASTWDGYVLATQGRSGFALGISTMASFFGGLIGWIMLILLSPPLTAIALAMGPSEYFVMGLLALSLLSLAAAGQTVKGLILGGVGLLISFVGQDPVTGTNRFTFGTLYLQDGFRLIALMLGLFAVSEGLAMAEKGGQIAKIRKVSGQMVDGMKEVLRHPVSLVRASLIGSVLGAMPALGISTSNVAAYLIEKKMSKEPEKFGTGHGVGLLAPEAANNACSVTDMVPTFTLGIPGSATTAVFMAALMIHGVQIGPAMFRPGGIGYTVYAGVLLTQIMFFVVGLLSIRWVMKIVTIPNSILAPMVLALAFVGAFADRGRLSDVLVTLVVGVLGYILKKYGWPPACLVLGIVLGTLVESNFSRAMLISGGDYFFAFKRPISLIMVIILVFFLASPYFKPLYRRIRGSRGATQG